MFRALELGALDFIAKPSRDVTPDLRSIEHELASKISLVRRLQIVRERERARALARTDPCPEGEVCRYDHNEQCGAHPVCVNPDTLACRCETYPTGGLACPCPDYEGPVNELGQVVLECNTLMSPGPVTSNEFANCIN